MLYARDLRHLVEIERAQRGSLESAYQETVSALASALGTKDTGTRQHSQRVQRYALELAAQSIRSLPADPALEYGFLLHDVGKIGVPDQILLKPGPLSPAEWRVMKAHTLLGAQMIGGVAFLQRRRRRGRPLAPRALGRRGLSGRADAARRSRSAPASSPSPTRSTRSRTTGPTARPAAGATLAARSSRRRASSSTRSSSTRTATASTSCTRSAESSWPPRKLAAMDFSLTADQREIQALAHEFAQAEIEPHAAAWDREHRFPTELFGKLAELGLMGVCVPAELGGAGADFLSYILVLEELSRADAGVGVTVAVHTSACTLPMLTFGTDEQRDALRAAARARSRRSARSPSPSRRRGRTRARSGPAPRRTAKAGRSPARSSGSRTAATQAPSCCSPARTSRSRARAASPRSFSTTSTSGSPARRRSSASTRRRPPTS